MDDINREDGPKIEDQIMVEFRSLFTAKNKEEADKLQLALYDTVQEIVCPFDENSGVTCNNCGGTLINPDLVYEELAELDLDDDYDKLWLPGLPCAECAESDTPGIVYPHSRTHIETSTIWEDGEWYDSDDRRNRSFYIEVLQTWDIDGPEAARELIEHALIHLTDNNGEMEDE